MRYLAAESLSERRYAEISPRRRRDVVAIYDDETRTIFLTRGWSGRDPAELSILVHEMVHHLQNMAGLDYGCPAERERLAYEAQAKWLRMFGADMSIFDLDPMTIKIMSACIGP